MGKGDRPSSKPSSSARAAEVLASKAGAAGFGFGGGNIRVGPNVVGFGFGAVAPANRPTPAAAEYIGGVDYGTGEIPLPAQVDGELAQCIRHLAKKDHITKVKALQNLRMLIPSRTTADLLTAMPPWIYMYSRLILDSSRAVRSENAASLASLLTALGKAMAPHLKALMGPWFLAMYDLYGDAAEASKNAFTSAFPTFQRQLDVLLFCRKELMSYIKDQMAATPQQLGDAKKDGPEELEERHERVQAACLAALVALIGIMAEPSEGAANTAKEPVGSGSTAAAAGVADAREEVLGAIRSILCHAGFWKATVGSKSATVRRAAYNLARCAAQHAKGMLIDDDSCAAESAMSVLGALGEKEPGNHGAMWEAVLTYGRSCPDNWRHVNLRKMILPRLYALLRHGCHGSATISFPALLPLLPLLPPGTLGSAPDVLAAILEAAWMGMRDPTCASRAAKSAILAAYKECLAWGLINSTRLIASPQGSSCGAGGGTISAAVPGAVSPPPAPGALAIDPAADVDRYCRALLGKTLVQHMLPALLGSKAQEAAAAREVAAGLAQALAFAEGGPAGSVPLNCLSEALSECVIDGLEKRVMAVAAAAAAAGSTSGETEAAEHELAVACDGTTVLLDQIRIHATACSGLGAEVAVAAAQGVLATGPSRLPPATMRLLATLLRQYGHLAEMGTILSVQPALQKKEGGGMTGGISKGLDTGLAAVGGGSPSNGSGVGSFNFGDWVAAFKAGPTSGTVAEATADLLVAFCATHHDNPAGLWDLVLGAVLKTQNDQDALASSGSKHGDDLRRASLLLQRYAALEQEATCGGGSGDDGGSRGQARIRTTQEQQLSCWGSASLDALAVQLACGAGLELDASAQRMQCLRHGDKEQGQELMEQAAKSLLAVALGANATGVVMLQPSSASQAVRSLTGHLMAAVKLGPDGGDTMETAAKAHAAVFAVNVLRGPLSAGSGGSGKKGIWQVLPEEACAALAAVVQLAWQVSYSRLPGHNLRHRHRGIGGSAGEKEDMCSGSGSEGEDYDQDKAHMRRASRSASSEEGVEDVVERISELGVKSDGSGGGGVATRLAMAQIAASRLWSETQPLVAAASVLSPSRVHQLVRHLSKLLADCVAAATPPSHSVRLSPRDWAAYAVELVEATPGGEAQHQAVLDVLLAARPEWQAWSALVKCGASIAEDEMTTSWVNAGTVTSPAGIAGLTEPSLEYLARLTEALGPEVVLMSSTHTTAENDGKQDETEDGDEKEGNMEPAPETRNGSLAPPVRYWVLLELICSHHAASSCSAVGNDAPEGGDEAGEELSSHGVVEHDSDTACRLHHRSSGSSARWRRVLDRVSEAMLEHLVSGVVAEAKRSARRGVAGGVNAIGLYGALLSKLIDVLAEGCRACGDLSRTSRPSSNAVMTASGDVLPATQAAFFEALCHVAACMARTSMSEGSYSGGVDTDARSALPPPPPPALLSHQQRLCLHWLSTFMPGSDSRLRLPPHALLRLLQVAAGPVRLAAARAASHGALSSSEYILAAAGLPELSCAWLRHCLSQPAVLQESTELAVVELEMASACFPVLQDAYGGNTSSSMRSSGSIGGGGDGTGVRVPGTEGSLVRSSLGAGLSASERPLLKQLIHHQLVRHAGIAAANRQLADAGPAASIHARAAIMRLAHAAVVYDWRGLGQPEWHALLQVVQHQLMEAVMALTECLGQLAAAARTAAGVFLHQPPGTTLPGAMALQLLRKLCQRGVLGRVDQGRELEETMEASLEACSMGVSTQAAAQLASTLTDLQEEVALEAGGKTAIGAAAVSREYSNIMTACQGHAMQLAISLGAIEYLGATFGSGASAAVATWLDRHHDFWAAIMHCAGRAFETPRGDPYFLTRTAEASAQALSQAGLDVVEVLMAVTLTPGSHLLQPLAYRLLLGDALLPQLSLAESATSCISSSTGSSSTSGSVADLELPQYDGDDVAFLTACGIRPEMAPLILPAAAAGVSSQGESDSIRVYLTAWALLLAHALNLDTGSPALAVLRQVLREVEPVVHGFLDRLVPELCLQQQNPQSGKQSQQAYSGGEGGGANALFAATSPTELDVERWRLADMLREIGMPLGTHAIQATCRMLYRAVLRTLPATARGWFSDLRDRGLAVAIETYTAAVEGPALLAGEMSSVQAFKQCWDGDDRFTVRALPATREVVATLEVEDGAVLELVVRLPACLPLRPPEVECRRKVGVTEARLRKWMLHIATFLRNQNGSVADAISLWKRNVDSEFEGVEPCLICYSVISSVNSQLPRLECRTCNVRFHPACLYKWFKSAGKSQCPHCQALW